LQLLEARPNPTERLQRGASYFVLPAILLLTALALVMSGIAIMFQIRRDRLPDATRFEKHTRAPSARRAASGPTRAELSIVEQKIQQRDRLIAEERALKNGGPPFWPNLLPWTVRVMKIEEVKSEAAAAAAELAGVTTELTSKRSELEKLRLRM